MRKFLIVTNNPGAADKYPGSLLIEGSPVDVIREAGNLILNGYALWSSPLPPNGRLMKNPFRSVALVRCTDPSSGGRDFRLIGNAEERLSKLVFLSSEGIRGEDLAYMDLELLEIAMREVRD